jgi:SSS family solute:Na+ symporter
MAIAAGVTPLSDEDGTDVNTIVPLLFEQQFPSWFAGVAFAAIGIGALVPAAIMSIAAANLWTRNIYKEYLNKDATPKQEARSSKLASLVVKVGALLAILALDPQFSIDLQLIGGVVMLQTLPAVALALYTRWFHSRALIAGWAVGMAVGFWTLYQIPQRRFEADGTITVVKEHFGGSAFPLADLGFDTRTTIYAGILATAANLLVCVLGTLALRGRVADGPDSTLPEDYTAEAGDPGVKDLDEIVH